jgi:hypothetical protein
MTIQEVADALLEWTRELLPELQGGYSFIPLMTWQELPDVVWDVGSVNTQVGGGVVFPHREVQQAWIRRFDCAGSIMIENSDPQLAAESLRDMADRLTASLMEDGSLGGRVPFISPFFSFDFTAPFVERDDGTRGREMTMELIVGEFIEEAS